MNNHFTLLQLLQNGTASIIYTKNTGESGNMNCTLLSEYIPEPNVYPTNTPQLLNESTSSSLMVWDMDAQAWELLNINSIKSIKVIKK